MTQSRWYSVWKASTLKQINIPSNIVIITWSLCSHLDFWILKLDYMHFSKPLVWLLWCFSILCKFSWYWILWMSQRDIKCYFSIVPATSSQTSSKSLCTDTPNCSLAAIHILVSVEILKWQISRSVHCRYYSMKPRQRKCILYWNHSTGTEVIDRSTILLQVG